MCVIKITTQFEKETMVQFDVFVSQFGGEITSEGGVRRDDWLSPLYLSLFFGLGLNLN